VKGAEPVPAMAAGLVHRSCLPSLVGFDEKLEFIKGTEGDSKDLKEVTRFNVHFQATSLTPFSSACCLCSTAICSGPGLLLSFLSSEI
jgi:hypothetical protein